MRNQFTDIYSFLGIQPDLDQSKIQTRTDEILTKAKDLNDKGLIDDEKLEAILICIDIVTDEDKRSEYDEKGHDDFIKSNETPLQKISFIGGDHLHEDFYDLFDLDKNATTDTVKRTTAIQMKKLHPDSGGPETTPEQFETIKRAREILTDEDKRSEYDEKGHNAYVSDNIDVELRGFGFTGRESVIETVEENRGVDEEDIESLIKFQSESSRTDPTKSAVKEDPANPASEKQSVDSEDTVADAVKKRKKLRDEQEDAEKKRKRKKENKSTSSNSSGGGLFVGILSFVTGLIGQLITSTIVILLFTYGLFVLMDVLGIGIGIIIGLGIYMIILKRK